MESSSTAASPSAGSGSIVLQNSGSSEDLKALMDQRKRKRMLSNRDSARRSRLRKQRHLDDLTAQAARLRGENHRLVSVMNTVTHHYLTVETENSILRVQIDELSNRLESLNEIIAFSSSNGNCEPLFDGCEPLFDGFMLNPMNSGFGNQQQPILASAEMFLY